MAWVNNKLATTLIVLFTTTILLALTAIIIVFKTDYFNHNGEPTIDDIIKVSVDVPEITTNLNDGNYIKISFKVLTNGKQAKEEFTKRDFQIKNIIISELSEMGQKSFPGKEGLSQFEERLKEQFNEVMQNGKVEKVYITSYIIS